MLIPSGRQEVHTSVIEKRTPASLLLSRRPAPATPAPGSPVSPLLTGEDPTLERLIAGLKPQPSHSSILGLCEDGLPLIVDLWDPSPGSILVRATHALNRVRFLANFLSATIRLNHPADFHYFLIGTKPDRYTGMDSKHCQLAVSPRDPRAMEIVYTLTGLAEQRRTKRGRSPLQCLVIDDLSTFLASHNQETGIHLKWLVRHGARRGIWVIAAHNPQNSTRDAQHLANQFGTQIFAETERQITAQPAPPAVRGSAFPAANYYTLKLGSTWIRFVVPA